MLALEAGIPDLAIISNALLVPFEARGLRHATVAWINPRWFFERGIDIREHETRARVERWLLAEFAFVVPSGKGSGGLTSNTRTLHADRYGSTDGMSPHGGSGRVATIGRFQAKGVGITPLAGAGAHAGHAHGCVSVAEGIREAIYAEVVSAEFPHGAVPIIAILDTGLRFSSPDAAERYDQNVRRGLIIRPATLRLAHVERAPLFQRSLTGFSNSQIDDAHRARDVVADWLDGSTSARASGFAAPELRVLQGRIAEQIAFGQVHRLFNGGYFSSNVSAQGELLDFGNMHALPDWRSAKVLGHAPGFGSEMKILTRVVQSLSLFFKKYSRGRFQIESAAALQSHATASYQRAFRFECLRLWGIGAQDPSPVADPVAEATKRYYSAQQRSRVRYQFGEIAGASRNKADQPFVYDDLLAFLKSGSRREMACGLIRQVLGRGPQESSKSAETWLAPLRYLRPRPTLERKRLLDETHALVGALDERPASDWTEVNAYIQRAVNGGRRHWPRLPLDVSARGHVYLDGSSALMCVSRSSGEECLWVEGGVVKGRLWLFDGEIAESDLEGYGVQVEKNAWSAAIPMPRLGTEKERNGFYFEGKAGRLRIPPMSVLYEDVAWPGGCGTSTERPSLSGSARAPRWPRQ